jgi:transposase InsO family protein
MYICLFTCASTRAVHLEVVTDLAVPTFISEAFRRFASRKSLPKVLISDNASTYQSAAEELLKLLKSPLLETHLSNRAVQWRFIPKRAPWYGGFWERLIGLTKITLKRVLGRASVQLSELQTIVVEIEAILNDRPLTFVSSNIEDEQPLTPSHLLYGRRITALPHPLIEEEEWSDPTFNEDPTLVQHLANIRANLIHHF